MMPPNSVAVWRVDGGWPDLAWACSNTDGCIAVSLYSSAGDYNYCFKTKQVALVADEDGLMSDACLGILVKV